MVYRRSRERMSGYAHEWRSAKLDGAKFSTRRRHAIWVADIISAGTSVDSVRWYTALTSPLGGSGNFDVAEYVTKHNRVLVDGLAAFLGVTGRWIGAPAPISGRMLDAVTRVMQEQDAALSLRECNLSKAAAVIY